MSTEPQSCYCGTAIAFQQCCQPLIENKIKAESAEALMRSRFSAYVVKNYHYILQTYGLEQQKQLTISQLAESAKGTKWLGLDVLSHKSINQTAQVEFKAFYQIDAQFYLMHEISDFIFEQRQWRYTSGQILADSGEIFPKRNDPCVCQSNKKFKKCCGKYS